jgi:predicted site-specific integrase-resolvase
MTTPIQSDDRRLSYAQAAVRLGISQSTLTVWIRRGLIRREIINLRRCYIDAAEVERLLRGTDAA